MTNATSHAVTRSVEINLRVTVSNLPVISDAVLTSRLREMVDNIDVIITDSTSNNVEIDYTLNIKHLADHVVRSFHPTPF